MPKFGFCFPLHFFSLWLFAMWQVHAVAAKWPRLQETRASGGKTCCLISHSHGPVASPTVSQTVDLSDHVSWRHGSICLQFVGRFTSFTQQLSQFEQSKKVPWSRRWWLNRRSKCLDWRSDVLCLFPQIEFVTGTKKGTNPSSTAAPTTSNTTTTTATSEPPTHQRPLQLIFWHAP